MFKDIFGNSPQTKILDFFADHPSYDYNISEISKHSEVSRPTVYKIIQILLKKKLIIKTRESANSSLYKLNIDNTLVQAILKFDIELSEQIAKIQSKNTIKNYEPALYPSKSKAAKG